MKNILIKAEEEEKSPIENLEFDSPKETDKSLDLDAALGLKTEEND